MKKLASSAIIIISVIALYFSTTGLCVEVPNTPIDVDGTDSEYRELLGVWKGSWGQTDNIMLIHKISAGKVYFSHSWGDEKKSVERIGEVRIDEGTFFFNYQTPNAHFALSCKKGETTMKGRRTISSTKKGSEVLGTFQKVK